MNNQYSKYWQAPLLPACIRVCFARGLSDVMVRSTSAPPIQSPQYWGTRSSGAVGVISKTLCTVR